MNTITAKWLAFIAIALLVLGTFSPVLQVRAQADDRRDGDGNEATPQSRWHLERAFSPSLIRPSALYIHFRTVIPTLQPTNVGVPGVTHFPWICECSDFYMMLKLASAFGIRLYAEAAQR